MDFACVARARRVDIGVGQADLARTIGVSRQWVVDFEACQGSVEFGLVLRVYKALGIKLYIDFTAHPPDWTVPIAATNKRRTRAFRTYSGNSRRRDARPRWPMDD